ncbi:hypothetical protein BGX34_007060 [Mortierella sp. NVP85]|nr:hypothetical protein BGX34_007060 [Mortierella sp. NVP85]
MSPRNPFELPEITAHIASYLCNKELTSCVRVSKSWRDIFLPHRWRDITRSFEYDIGEEHYWRYGPSEENITKHRHLVLDLTLRGDFDEDDMCPLPNLQQLKIYFSSRERVLYGERKVFNWDLAGISPQLERFLISDLDLDRGSCQRLLEPLRLKNLELWKVDIMPDAVQEIWEACKNLESLSMKSVNFQGNLPSIPTDAVFPRLRTLIMTNVKGLSQSQQLSMVLHCPRLESFDPSINAFAARMVIDHPVQKDRWSQLDNLNSHCGQGDEEWASLFEKIGNCFENVPHLHLFGSEIGPRSIKALGPYFSNLVDLRSPSFKSSVILSVLCSGSKLEILHVRNVFASDIVKGGPWICQQLRDLKIGFRVQETERDLQPLIFERLSTLVRLTTLNMTINDYGEELLHFRSDCGLRQLASLQELRTVVFCHGYSVRRCQQLEMIDVKWMIGNWKKLKGIYGSLNSDREVTAQLEDLLGNHGISHGYYWGDRE